MSEACRVRRDEGYGACDDEERRRHLHEERRQARRLRLRGPDQELRAPGGTGPHPDHCVQEGHSEDGQRPPERQEVTEIE